MAERPLLDRPAGLAQGLPVGQLLTTAWRLARIVWVALPMLRRSWVLASATRAASSKRTAGRGRQRLDVDISRMVAPDQRLSVVRARLEFVVFGRGEDLGEVDRPHPGALAVQGAADVHQARVVGRGADLGPGVEHAAELVAEHGHRRVGVLDGERPAEAAALLGPGQLDQVDPPDRPQSRSGASPTRSIRSEWQVGWYVTRCGIIRPDVLDAQLVDEELRKLEDPRGQRADGPARLSSPASAAACGYISRTIPTHEAEGETTTSASPKTSTNRRTSGIASRW